MERSHKELERVTNLPSLNVGTWDGRSSLVACARCTFATFVDATIRTYMTSGPFVKDGESRQGNG
jgi:hypothetical protein